jgi:hypothetical protein
MQLVQKYKSTATISSLQSGIGLFPMSDSRVRHGVEKLSRRDTTLV